MRDGVCISYVLEHGKALWIQCSGNTSNSDCGLTIVSYPAPSNAKSEKGSGQNCIGHVSPVQPTVRANQVRESKSHDR